MKKRGWIGIVVLVLIIVIALGVGAYFMFFSGPYPSSISGSPLNRIDDESAQAYSECFDFITDSEVCIVGIGSATYGDVAERNDVVRIEVTLGTSTYKSYLKSLCSDPLYSCERNIVIDGSTYDTQKMIYWFYEDNKYFEIKQWGDSMRILGSPVVKYFMKKYPPIVF